MRRMTMLTVLAMLVFAVSTTFAGTILVVDDDNRYNNETRIYAALTNLGIAYDSYDCDITSASPDSTAMSAYDLVIWFTGDDYTDLYFWNAGEVDNPHIINYLDQGGNLWMFGLSISYDRYGGAADTFAVGDFMYDYVGISSYDAQSSSNDGGLGVSELDQTTNVISSIDTITWNTGSGNLSYVDGGTLTEDAVSHYVMGPDTYPLAGLSTVQSHTTDTFTLFSSWFNPYYFSSTADRDTWVSDVIDWFELPEDTLATISLVGPADGSSYVMDVLVGSGIDLTWEDNGATSYTVYFSADSVLIDSVEGLTDTTTFVDHAALTALMGASDYIAIDWYVSATMGGATVISDPFTFALSNQTETILVVDDDGYQNYEYSIYESLQRTHYAFDSYDTYAMGGSPDATTLAAYDLVIWYTGNDGGDLYFWDGIEADNPAVISYLDNGGRMWINGLDVLYDRFGGAPDSFVPGDFAYDYMGLASYNAQSRADDGGGGAPLIARLPSSTVSALDTVTWRFATAWYIDAVTPNYRGFDDYTMGPDDYSLAGQANVCHHVGDDFIVLNSFFNFQHLSNDSTRDVFMNGVINWFNQIASATVPTAAVLTAPADDTSFEIFVTDTADVVFSWEASTDAESGVEYRFLLGESATDIAGIIVSDQSVTEYVMNEHVLYNMIHADQDTLELFWQVLTYDADHNITESAINSFLVVRDYGSGPAPFSLISPHIGAMIRVHETNVMDYEFSWETSTDPGGLTVAYTLMLINEDDSTIFALANGDTTVSISSTTLLTLFGAETVLDLTWDVVASNSAIETHAMVPFDLTLVHASPQEISILVVDDDNRYNNETKLYTALDDSYYLYETFDTDAAGASPDSADLAGYDLVIWFAGDDGVGLYFWNGADEDNSVIPQYLDAGGRMWLYGADFLYDRYGSAPDFFGPGELIYDYFGTSAYLAQAWANDDNTGLEMLVKATGSAVTTMDTIRWGSTSGIVKYVDGCALGEGALADLNFGPAAYQLADMANSYHMTDGNFISMSSWFNPYYMVDNAARANWVGDVVNWFENTLVPEGLTAPVLTAPAAGTQIALNALTDQFTFTWEAVSSTETVYYQLVVESDAVDVVPYVKTTLGTTLTLDGNDLFDLAGYGTDELTLTWKVTAQTAMAAYSVSAEQSHAFIEGINEAPFAFELLMPVADDTLSIDTLGQSFTFTWTPSFDPEGDAINYQFILVGAADTLINANTADTSVTFNATELIDLMAGAESITTFWKVFAQDGEFSTGADPRMLYLENHVVGIDEKVIPEAYALYQNYPNPFNPTTTIRYDLPEAAEVFLTIYDIKGRVVNQLQVGSQSAGSYALQWNGASQAGLQVATGVYLCRIQTASYSHVIKMLYLK